MQLNKFSYLGQKSIFRSFYSTIFLLYMHIVLLVKSCQTVEKKNFDFTKIVPNYEVTKQSCCWFASRFLLKQMEERKNMFFLRLILQTTASNLHSNNVISFVTLKFSSFSLQWLYEEKGECLFLFNCYFTNKISKSSFLGFHTSKGKKTVPLYDHFVVRLFVCQVPFFQERVVLSLGVVNVYIP